MFNLVPVRNYVELPFSSLSMKWCPVIMTRWKNSSVSTVPTVASYSPWATWTKGLVSVLYDLMNLSCFFSIFSSIHLTSPSPTQVPFWLLLSMGFASLAKGVSSKYWMSNSVLNLLFCKPCVAFHCSCWCFGHRAYHTRAWDSGATSPSIWWTIITPFCILGK